jgi:predicted DCC family thiol-disulfide oxidoreductase YuxK
VNTETTESIRGWVFYDADCAFCSGWAARFHELLARRGYHLAPLQAEWVRLRLGLKEDAPLLEMKLLTTDGRVLGGADALIHIARSVWWAWPLFVMAQFPGISAILRIVYRWVARNRHCHGNHCLISGPPNKTQRHGTSSFYEFP